MNTTFRPRRPLLSLRHSRSASSSPDKKSGSSCSSVSSSSRTRRLEPRRRENTRNLSRDSSPRLRRESPRRPYKSPSRKSRRSRSLSKNLEDSRRHRAEDRERDKSPGVIEVNTRRNLNEGDRFRGTAGEGDKPRFLGAEEERHLTREELKATVVTVDCRRNSAAEGLTPRNFVNPQDIVIVRRAGEGSRPLFDRDELKKAEHSDARRVVSRTVTRDSDGRRPRERERERQRPRSDRYRRDFRFPVRVRNRRSKSKSPPNRRGGTTERESPREVRPTTSRDGEETYEHLHAVPAPVAPGHRHFRPYPMPVPYGAHLRRPYMFTRPRLPYPRIPMTRVPMLHYYPRMYPPYRMP